MEVQIIIKPIKRSRLLHKLIYRLHLYKYIYIYIFIPFNCHLAFGEESFGDV